MPRISTDNYDTVASWNGSQDLFVVEQPDGTKVATPAMVKHFIEAGDFEATGEIIDGHGNILAGKAENNPSAFSDYTNQGIYAAAQSMTLTDIKGGYKVKDGICYVNVQFSFTGTFYTPGAWAMLGGFPISAINGVPFLATPTNNDANSKALLGGRMNNQGLLFIINSGTITGDNSTAFTFIGSYPVANS